MFVFNMKCLVSMYVTNINDGQVNQKNYKTISLLKIRKISKFECKKYFEASI